ncbi:FAD/NAD(P)-binding domain-containing protein [Thozetella sp. PMI_491]|nr:FAD/NAD(P)-binding domain-containing protein [Thozetella sp. PMI_491]
MPYISEDDSKPVGAYPQTDIDVLIVGTGFAGLTAAIECIRKGHRVRVLERNKDIITSGDLYFMGLSATRFLKHWPDMKKEFDEISLTNLWMTTHKHEGTSMTPMMSFADRVKAQGLMKSPPGTFQLRPLVYQMYIRQVEQLGVDIQFGKKVVDYFEDEDKKKPGVVTDQGERFEADVVIAADGVGSKSQSLLGGQVRAKPSGRAMWRAVFPIHHLDKHPEVKAALGMHKTEHGESPVLRTWLGPGTYAKTVTLQDKMIWLMNHNVTGSEKESWHNMVDSDEVLANMDIGNGPVPWAPVFKDLVRLTPPGSIVNFELLWRDPQPSWASPGGRVVAIGDAAHSYLPSSGNGATQAIEDAISLATCLQLGGIDKIPQAVNAHIRMRFVRNACAQKLGFSNAELLQDTDWRKVKVDPSKAQPKLPRWVWSHDPEAYAYEVYDKLVESIEKGVPLGEEDIPPNYPPGYKYEPWTIDEIMEDMRNGKPVQLGSGNWD